MRWAAAAAAAAPEFVQSIYYARVHANLGDNDKLATMAQGRCRSVVASRISWSRFLFSGLIRHGLGSLKKNSQINNG